MKATRAIEIGCPTQSSCRPSSARTLGSNCCLPANIHSIDALAMEVKLHPKVIRNRIRLAFLAPTITNAILSGRQPAALSLETFNRAMPMNWNRQQAPSLTAHSYRLSFAQDA